MTFDDGPSAQTDTVLRALRRHDAHATFFAVGQQIPGRESILRRAVRDGNEIGNHSTSHSALPSRADIRQTSDLIEAATGSRPCVFRPPSGVTSRRLTRDARKLGMSTILWNVDSADWGDQSPQAIRARALAGIHRGSIVLLHDGGGDRAGTGRSVSAIVDALHARKYEVVTVSELFSDPRRR